MKAILEFDFDKEGSDDRDQFQDAINGWRWKMSISELDNWLRNQIKHSPDDMSNDTYKAFKQCREKLTEIVHNENLTFE
jgi:hypothetical protein